MIAPNDKSPGRNDHCPCGSGQKYKNCCLGKDADHVPRLEPGDMRTLLCVLLSKFQYVTKTKGIFIPEWVFDEYPKDLRDESAQLSDWIHDLKRLYKHRLLIRLIEAQSLTGIYKSLRHRIRRYPAFIIEGKETVSGWDKARLEGLLDRHVPRKPRR